MRRIFICYRRDEAEYIAGALGRALRSHYGPDQVFRDKENIAGGASWKRTVLDAIDRDSTLLVLIGEGWAEVRDETGRRRLDNVDDPLRMELADALRDGAKVFPVLLGDARMPTEAQLPPELRYLAELNALRLRDGDWDHDLATLQKALDASGFRPVARPSQKLASPSFITMSTLLALGLLGLLGEEESEWDDTTYLGFVGLAVAALIASVFAYRDHKHRSVRAMWISKSAVGLCVLTVLASVGMREAAAARRDENEDLQPGPQDSGLITGAWMDPSGLQFSLVQQGSAVTGQYVANGSLVTLSGLVAGSQLTLDVRFATGAVGRMSLSITPDAQSIQGSYLGPFGEQSSVFLRRL